MTQASRWIFGTLLFSLLFPLTSRAAQGPYHFVVDPAGGGDYTTIQAALDAAPEGQRTLIFVRKGVYAEKLFIGNRWESSNKQISLIGEDRDGVVVTWDDYNGKTIDYPGKGSITADGATCGTFTINAPDFYMENVTVKNPSTSAQAVALCQKGDRHVLKHCAILGNQDTHRTKKGRRYFYYDCVIEGGVDFIYAGGTCYFHRCRIVSNRGGYCTAPEDVPNRVNLSDGKPLYYGFFFRDCDIVPKDNSVGDGSCYLGRPWGPQSGSVFMECRLGRHIHRAGWNKMGEETYQDCCFAEYHSLNAAGTALADVSGRVNWSLQISDKDHYRLLKLDDIYARVSSSSFKPLERLITPASPSEVKVTGQRLTWTAVEGAAGYAVYLNGECQALCSTASWESPAVDDTKTYTVRSVSALGSQSGVGGELTAAAVAHLDTLLNLKHYLRLGTSVRPSAAAGKVMRQPDAEAYLPGTRVSLTAQPAYAYRFVRWEDALGQSLSNETTLILTVSEAANVTAVFEPMERCTLTTGVVAEGEGMAVPSSLVSCLPAPETEAGASFYLKGTDVTLTADATHPVFRFKAWSDGNTDNPRTLTLESNVAIEARYEVQDYIAAWLFGQGSTAEYRPETAASADFYGELNLIDKDDNYLSWTDLRPGCYSEHAATSAQALSAEATFRLETDLRACGRTAVWSAVQCQANGYRRVYLEYSADGTTYETLAETLLPQAGEWRVLKAVLPESSTSTEYVYLRWRSDLASEFIGNPVGPDGLSLSDLWLLPAALVALPSTTSTEASVRLYDLTGRRVHQQRPAPGLYVLRQTDANGRETGRLVRYE